MKIQIVKFEDGTYGVRKRLRFSDVPYSFLDKREFRTTKNAWMIETYYLEKDAHYKTLQHAANARWAWWAKENKQPDYGVPINEKRGIK